jgi:arginyl-tRNA synthetase
LKNLVDTWLRQALARLPESMVPPSGRNVCIEVQRPNDARRGDFASNLALRLASAARRDARPLAEAIKSALPADAALAKVEIAGAGFLNFFLSESSYHGEILRALRDAGEFGKSDIGLGRAVRVEVASVDPDGPLHAGHARQAAFGASVAALLEASGYRVVRECRIARASRTLAQCAAAPRSARSDGRAADLAALRQELSEFGVTFDAWGLGGWGDLEGWGGLGGSGAVEGPTAVEDPTGVEDPTAVENPTGVEDPTGVENPTGVEGPTAVEDQGFAAAPALLRRGRKRPAPVLPGERLTLRALRAEVGNDAVRLFCVMRASDQPLLFDLGLAGARSLDNPLYSLQYAHARIASVQRQLEDRGLEFHPSRAAASLGLLAEPLERTLMRRVSAYREIIERSATERAPHLLARYLRRLAEDFHTYYAAHALVVPDVLLCDARLALASAVQVVIRNGLRLLGVAAPDTV